MKNEQWDSEKIDEVAKLAALQLTTDEKSRFSEQFEAILGYFAEIDKIDVQGVEPLVTPVESHRKWRSDEVQVCDNREEILQEAPEAVGDLYKVPPVV